MLKIEQFSDKSIYVHYEINGIVILDGYFVKSDKDVSEKPDVIITINQ